MRRAILYVQEGSDHRDKQEALILKRAEERGYQVVSFCRDPDGVADTVKAGGVDIVLTALDNDPRLARALGEEAWRIEFVRPSRRRRRPIEMIRRMLKLGLSVEEIAEVTDESTSEIRRSLHGPYRDDS